MTTKLRIVENKTDAFAIVRDAAENAARNLGCALDLPQLSPELWQKVLVVTELQMRMRSIDAALLLDERPQVGATVTVGKRYATVVRHTPEGVGVAFRLPFGPLTFNERVIL